jgi:ABC-type uncharacterized transport system substrate-binding protein
MRGRLASSHRARLPGLTGAGLFLIVLGGLAAPASASRVVVLKSLDLAPYDLAAAGVLAPSPSGFDVLTVPKNGKPDLVVHSIWEARPDAIVALGSRALNIACSEFGSVPVVFGMVADPEDFSEDRELGGIALLPSAPQVLGAIRDVLPAAVNITVVFDPTRSSEEVARFYRAGQAVGLNVRAVEFSDGSDLHASTGVLAGSCDCLVIYPDPVLLSDKVFSDLAFKAFDNGVPVVGYSSSFASKGALMSVEADYTSVGADLRRMVAQVLAGARPREIGVRSPSHVKMTVNKAVASELGIAIPEGSLRSADVIAVQPALP